MQKKKINNLSVSLSKYSTHECLMTHKGKLNGFHLWASAAKEKRTKPPLWGDTENFQSPSKYLAKSFNIIVLQQTQYASKEGPWKVCMPELFEFFQLYQLLTKDIASINNSFHASSLYCQGYTKAPLKTFDSRDLENNFYVIEVWMWKHFLNTFPPLKLG